MASKVLIDQLFIAPVILCCFLALNEIFQLNGLEAVKDKISEDFLSVWQGNISVWPAAMIFNFYFVPLVFRTVFVRVVAFFWMIYLSWKANK